MRNVLAEPFSSKRNVFFSPPSRPRNVPSYSINVTPLEVVTLARETFPASPPSSQKYSFPSYPGKRSFSQHSISFSSDFSVPASPSCPGNVYSLHFILASLNAPYLCHLVSLATPLLSTSLYPQETFFPCTSFASLNTFHLSSLLVFRWHIGTLLTKWNFFLESRSCINPPTPRADTSNLWSQASLD